MPTFQQTLFNQIRNNTYPQTYPQTHTEGTYTREPILGAGSTSDAQQIANEQAARTQQQAANEAFNTTEATRLELETAKANLALAQQKAKDAASPEAQAAAELAVQKSRLDIQLAQLNIAKVQNQMAPQDVAKLENQLALQRDQLKQQFDVQMQDARIANEWAQIEYQQGQITQRTQMEIQSRATEGALDRETTMGVENLRRSTTLEEGGANRSHTSQENLLDRAATAEENRMNREQRMQEAKLTAGVQLRGQELDRLTAMDTFATNTVANQIRKGELDVDRGYKVFQSALQAHRLPSEITANIGQALAPFVPHLSSYKAGEIPLGFESGGPFETALRQGGATSYDPSAYAAKPVGVDLFGIAKKFGATPPKGGIPDPNKIIPKVPDIQMPTSNLAGLQMSPDIEANIRNYLGSIPLPGQQ